MAWRASLAQILIVFLVFPGALHAMVPHHHGHTHAEQVAWQDLHGALQQHQASVCTPTIATSVVYTAAIPQPLAHVGEIRVAPRALSTGIEKYRRFG